MRLTNRPQYALAVAIAVGATALVYGLSFAEAQRCSGPPGPCWRDVTQESLWRRWKNGTDRQGQARKARESKR